jgi:hypothetical protein
VRKQFVRGRRETSRLMRTGPIAFGDTSIYANRRRSRSARLRGEREAGTLGTPQRSLGSRSCDQRVQTWEEIVRGGRYNAGTDLPAPVFAVRSVTRAFSLLLCTAKRREVRLFLRKSHVGSGYSVYIRSENALAQAPLASKGACDQPRTRRLGEHRNPVDQSARLMFLLPFKKCGDPVAQVREHRTGVIRALDR